MLPGLRLLFVITFLSVSVLIFGLGAAAYLRSAHDDIASAPWRPIETPATARVDLAPATLALLRVEPETAPVAPAPGIDVPVTAPVETKIPADTSVAADAPPPPRTEQVVALQPAAENTPQPPREIAVQTPAPARDAAPAIAEKKVPETNVLETKAAEVKEPPPAPTVVATLSADKVEPPAKSVEESPPVAAASPPTETPAPEPAPAPIAPGADTLKADDKTIDTTPPAKTAALAEPALAAVAPLSTKDVKIPNPRIDPAVIEARRKRVIAQQRARARAVLARRIAAARARAAAQAKAAADPFGTPASTTAPRAN